MGYYTNYQLTIQKDDKYLIDKDKFIQQLKEIAGYTFYAYESNEFLSSDGIKWYDHNIDMQCISKDFPDVIFKLCGEGEIGEDLWQAYFLNGKIQRCPAKITYDEFDENKLTNK